MLKELNPLLEQRAYELLFESQHVLFKSLCNPVVVVAGGHKRGCFLDHDDGVAHRDAYPSVGDHLVVVAAIAASHEPLPRDVEVPEQDLECRSNTASISPLISTSAIVSSGDVIRNTVNSAAIKRYR